MSKFIWTSELAQTALANYKDANKDNASLEAIAKDLGTTVPSVRGKLAIMGEYAKPVKVKKDGTASGSKETKAATVAAIEIFLSIPKGELASLDKGTVKAVNSLFEALKVSSRKAHAEMGLKES